MHSDCCIPKGHIFSSQTIFSFAKSYTLSRKPLHTENMNCKQLVCQACMMNTAGVHALASGNAPVAHQSFRQALETLSCAADLRGRESGPVEGVDSAKSNNWQATGLSHCPVPGLVNEGFYICNSALLYNIQDISIDDATIAMCCHSTMFNMALTLHQRGIAVGARSSLLSAGRLYEQCLKISADLPGPPEDANVIKMATLNNIAQLHCSLSDYKSAVETLDAVRALLQETDVTSPALTNILQMDDLFLNILVTSAPTTAPCA